MWRDLRTVRERDPAATNVLEILLLYPGLHALWVHRLAHLVWRWRVPFVPRWLSTVARFLTGIDIHPGAQIGRGFFIDHGAGVVIGETAMIGDDVTLYQGVTLGGTGKERGKRHPTLGSRVVVGVPGRITRREGRRVPGITLDHTHLPDPVQRHLGLLEKEVRAIEQHLQLWATNAQKSLLRELIEETETGVHHERKGPRTPDRGDAAQPREGGL